MTWVALALYLFYDEYKSNFEVDENAVHYVKLFISFCFQFEMESSDEKDWNSELFYLFKANLSSTIEISKTISQNGPLRDL